MKIQITTLLFSLMAFTSCMSRAVKRSYRHEMYIDFKNISYQGQNSTQNIYFEIDSTKGRRYAGKLIINHKDTLLLTGFEIGDNYPSRYHRLKSGQSGKLKFLKSCRRRNIPDTIYIENRKKGKPLQEKTTLFRRPRGCY